MQSIKLLRSAASLYSVRNLACASRFNHLKLVQLPIRHVGIDDDNKTGKYKIEKPKPPPSDYKENIDS